ncbi:uncharacterized protein LOC126779045 [Nymphalis io]|uniref:uncharacterized protein LOC126779045 n=1 Tax=Inachis io TaxID=171585 RepID=UPI0021699414|nr:uncharacterized protein LOC126779045 [Nymphalis io]
MNSDYFFCEGEIQPDLAKRLQHIATTGLPKDIRKELVDKHLHLVNCILIEAPTLNPEVVAAIPEAVHKRERQAERHSEDEGACQQGSPRQINEAVVASSTASQPPLDTVKNADYLLKVKSVNLSEKSESSTIAKNGSYPIPIKLPDIKLPVFSGKYTEWPTKDKYTQVLLATALVRVQTKNGSYQLLRALLDQGSQASFITESAVQLLGVKKTFVKSSVCGLGGNVSVLTSKAVVNIAISSIHDTETVIELGAHVLSRLTSFLQIKPIVMNNWPELKKLKFADPNYHTPGKIDILLGSDVYGKIIEEGLLRSPYGTTIAQKTNLGWVLSGQVISPTTHSIFVNLHTQMSDDELLKKFWELEAEPTDKINQRLTPEEQKCEDLFATTTKRDCKGRYIVRLPFTKETPASKYGNLREIAVRRFYGQEKGLIRNRDLKKQYDDTIEEYLQLGHMEQIKFNKNTEAVYLPHHAVIREDKATTKVRVVFDASCKGENGISLNDDLMIGPRLQPDLRHLIMKFRLGPICLVADIVKMYRMVKVAQQDVDYQRLVWHRNPEDDLKDYRLLRVTFGTSAAPYLAVKTLQQLALDEGTQFPFAAKRVLEDFYVDDLMTTCDTSNEAIFLYKELNNLMMRGGFKLQKWSSNSKLVMKILSKNEKRKESMEMITDHITKVLGLTWNRSTDKFVYSVHLEEQIIPVTKRRVISDISKLYDLLGWISPCIIPAKILIQKLWMSGISWDEELPSSLK